MLPELPKAQLRRLGARLWPRRFAQGEERRPASILDLTAVAAPNEAAAAEYYPAQYWYSMLQDSGQEPVSRHGRRPERQRHVGEGAQPGAVARHAQDAFAAIPVISSATSRRARSPRSSASSESSYEAWMHRIQVGPMAETMVTQYRHARHATSRSRNFADWTDRIAAGELPQAKPQRPQGVERNVVVTLWDWGDAKTYLHDEIATDKRNPTVNALGQDLQRDRGFDRQSADPRSEDAHGDAISSRHRAIRIRRPACSSSRATSRPSRRPIGARRSSGAARRRCTIRCSTRTAGSG